MSITDQRLARLLDPSSLARVIPQLAPETLHEIVQYRGLEACGDLVALATPAQLTSLLDLDLWRPAQPGRDEQFDGDRFGEWLEVLVEAGESVAARTVAALDTHFVVVGLSRYVRVFDPGTFEPHESSDDEGIDRHERMNHETCQDAPECEVGGYLVRARRTDAWDAIVALLITLETEQHDCFHAVMQGCRRLSNSAPEIDGLNDLLTTAEQYQYDVAVERERRRSRQGYATPADARAFLQMARQPRHTINPIAAAYFRATEDVLAESGLMRERPPSLLEAADEDPRTTRLPLLRTLMEFALHHDETAHLARSRELAFLANALLAGSSVQSRALTPQEASNAAACICNLGLECGGASPPDSFLVDHDLVAVFEAGWSLLYRDVSMFTADQLISTLAAFHCEDEDIRLGLRALSRTLVKERDAGTPWLARDAADVLAMLDITAWTSVAGLLDECPILPAALTAVLEGTTAPVSPTAFEFISTKAQIGDIRVFMTMLAGVLSR